MLPTKRGKASEWSFPPRHSLSGHQGGYEIHIALSRGKKIESEDCNLEKDVLVAFNLTLKKDGAFGSTRLREGKYNITSVGLVAHVIQMFYLEREAKKMCVSA